MAPKKSTPRNAFYFFMLHLQKTQGRQYSGGLREVSVAAGPIWDNMIASEKQPFELLARRERSGVKYTTQGQTFDEVIQAQKELKEKEELMQSTIKNTLIQLGRNTGFVSAPFFLAHVNFFCKKDDGTFYPSEFAIAAFSIARGIQKTYHTIVDLGDLPQGYTLKAMEHSKDTHQIPLPPNVPHGVKDSNEIMEKIHKYVYQFLDANETMPPFYTLDQLIPSTENMMSRWAVDFGRSSDYFRIFPLEQLLFDMKMFSLKPENQRPIIRGVRDDGFLHLATAQSILRDDLFMYRKDISCDFHETNDNTVHCSKSYVTRWGWTLANHLCCNMDVRLIPGQHCPKDTIKEDLYIDNQGLQGLAIGGWQEPAHNRRGRTEHPPSQAFGRGKPIKMLPGNAGAVNGTTSEPSGSHSPLQIIDHGALQAARNGTGRGSIRTALPAQPAWGAAAPQHSGTDGTGRGSIRTALPAQPAWGAAAPQHSEPDGTGRGSIRTVLPAQPAWGAAAPQHSGTGDRKWETEQFEDAHSQVRPNVNRQKFDRNPLRQPNSRPAQDESLARQADSLAQQADTPARQADTPARQADSSDQLPGAYFTNKEFPELVPGKVSVPPDCGRRTTARGSRGSSRGSSRGISRGISRCEGPSWAP